MVETRKVHGPFWNDFGASATEENAKRPNVVVVGFNSFRSWHTFNQVGEGYLTYHITHPNGGQDAARNVDNSDLHMAEV